MRNKSFKFSGLLCPPKTECFYWKRREECLLSQLFKQSSRIHIKFGEVQKWMHALYAIRPTQYGGWLLVHWVLEGKKEGTQFIAYVHIIVVCLCFWDQASYCSLGCLGTYRVTQIDLKLAPVFLLQPSSCEPPCLADWLIFFFLIEVLKGSENRQIELYLTSISYLPRSHALIFLLVMQ